MDQNEFGYICHMPSGWVSLCGMQFLRGYCVLYAEPVADSINALSPVQRTAFLCDMALVGDALLEVTDAYRINYAIMGNSEPVLHAHIVPRYLSEPDGLRKGLPWSYPNAYTNTARFDEERDQELLNQLRLAIQRKLERNISQPNTKNQSNLH